jgi:flagellar biosynthetic protein FliR
MAFTVQNLEFYLLVLVRVSGFVFTAPALSYQSVPTQIKAALSILLSILVIQTIPVVAVSYSGIIGFSMLVLKELMIGLILGFMCKLCFYIVHFSGHVMDMEMGLSMATMFDPTSNMQITVTGNIYNYFVYLLLVVTNMHYYIIRSIMESFQYFNIGQAVFRLSLKDLMIDFMAEYFVIALRIVLPVFCCMLLINVILGVLAKAAPQMNMFVVGIQIKLIVGIFVLILLVQTLPTVADFIFSEMWDISSRIITIFAP